MFNSAPLIAYGRSDESLGWFREASEKGISLAQMNRIRLYCARAFFPYLSIATCCGGFLLFNRGFIFYKVEQENSYSYKSLGSSTIGGT